MPLPPLNLNLANHSSAEGRQQSAFDNSGWNVYVGGASETSPWLVFAGLAALYLLLRRKG